VYSIRFVENGFKLWYNYVNVNSIFGYNIIIAVIDSKVIKGMKND
jgi:hypothetical protein